MYSYQLNPHFESYPLDEWGYPIWNDEYAGLDLSSVTSYGQQLGQKFGQWGSQAAQAVRQNLPDLGSYGQRLARGVGSGLESLNPLGDAPEKASRAADATAAAADAIAALSQRANASLGRADKTMKEHEETVRIIKFAVIGIGALGGVTLIFSMLKK